MKFARIIELDDGNQILLVRDYDETKEKHTVRIRTDVDGLQAETSLYYSDEDNADNTLENFSLESAEKYRSRMVELLS